MKNKTQAVKFTKEKARKLNKAYREALATNKLEFEFEGNLYVLGYAKQGDKYSLSTPRPYQIRQYDKHTVCPQ